MVPHHPCLDGCASKKPATPMNAEHTLLRITPASEQCWLRSPVQPAINQCSTCSCTVSHRSSYSSFTYSSQAFWAEWTKPHSSIPARPLPQLELCSPEHAEIKAAGASCNTTDAGLGQRLAPFWSPAMHCLHACAVLEVSLSRGCLGAARHLWFLTALPQSQSLSM